MNLLTCVVILLFNKLTIQGETILKVLHTSGFHAKFESTPDKLNNSRSMYGIARMLHFVNEQKEKHESTIFIDTMDWFTGSIWYSVHRANICSHFLNMFPVDAIGLGDEETNIGRSREERTKNFTNYILSIKDKTILCANCALPGNSPIYNYIKKSVILDVKGINGKVGITAVVRKNLVWEFDRNGLAVTDELIAIEKAVENLASENAKIIILIVHAQATFTTSLVKKLKGIHLLVNGHSHNLLYNGIPPDGLESVGKYPEVLRGVDGKDIPVVYCGFNGNFVGVFDLTINHEGKVTGWSGNPVWMGPDIGEDEAAKQLLEEFRPAVRKEREAVLGKCMVSLDSTCFWLECNLGNFITDAYVDYMADKYPMRHRYWTDAPISLIRSKYMASDINPGQANDNNVTVAHILSAIPSYQNLIALTINGSVLRSALEHAVSNVDDETSMRFLQMSGLHVTYDLSKRLNERVIKLRARCGQCNIPQYEPVEDSKMYKVVMTQALGGGIEEFTMFLPAFQEREKLGIADNEVLRAYIARSGRIYAGKEERIIIKNMKTVGRLHTSGTIRFHMRYLSYTLCVFTLTTLIDL